MTDSRVKMEGRKVCVVGGDGYVGSSLVSRLLARGYSVHATLLSTEENVEHLIGLPGAQDRLKLFDADLRNESSFDLPVFGCEGVFLVASPTNFASKDPEKEMIDVAVNGTLNVLKSCEKAKSVKRVVHTSSLVAMLPLALNEQGHVSISNVCVDESFWSPVDLVRKKQYLLWPYIVSKTLAEQMALKFAAEHKIDVVTIAPGTVGGPFITPFIPNSIQVLLSLLTGNEQMRSDFVKSVTSVFGAAPFVHINDVCDAQIFLMEQPEAQGRYLCSAHTLSLNEFAQFLAERYPDFKPNIQKFDDVAAMDPPTSIEFKSEKLRKSGFSFKFGLEDIFDDSISYCKPLGLFSQT